MSEQLMKELIARIRKLPFLPDKPEESAENTARALWHTASGKPVSASKAAELELLPLTTDQVELLHTLVDRRCEGRPLAHITGRQEFMGIEFHIDGRALIPRRETELLCKAAFHLVEQVIAEQGQAKVVDVCTGAGNVALSIACRAPKALVFAADLSEEAVELARMNCELLEVTDRVRFEAGDLFAPFENQGLEGRVDVITCNPPYISTQNVAEMAPEISDYEPTLAFDGGPFGVGIVRRVLTEAVRFLRPGGWLCTEVGQGQGEPMSRMIARNPAYGDLRTSLDEKGNIRALQMQKV